MVTESQNSRFPSVILLQVPFYWYIYIYIYIASVPLLISKYIHYKIRDKITYRFPNLNGVLTVAFPQNPPMSLKYGVAD